MRILIFKNLKIGQKIFFPILIILMIAGLVLSFMISSEIRNVKIDRAKTVSAEFVHKQAGQHLSKEVFLDHNHTEHYELFNEFFKEIETKEIVDIKVWDKQAVVIHSSKEEKVGKSFPENREFQKAIQGEIAVEIKPKKQIEEKYQIRDLVFEQLMEVYVPITFKDSGQIVGVIELYYNLDVLNQEIRRLQILVWGSVLGGFLAVLIVTFLIIRSVIIRPINKVKNIAIEIARGNMDMEIDISGKDEIAELAQSIDKMRKSLKVVFEEYEKGSTKKEKGRE